MSDASMRARTQRRAWVRCVALVIASAAVAVALCACAGNGGEEGDVGKEMPGTLVGVTWSVASGMMAHSEFDIEITSTEIVTCGFWKVFGEDGEAGESGDAGEEGGSGIGFSMFGEGVPTEANAFIRREHVPITPEQWADIVAICTELYPVMRQRVADTGAGNMRWPDPNIPVVDDGGHNDLAFRVLTPEGEQTIRFTGTSDRRIQTLYALLEELANPIGREIPRYEAPHLDGIYFSDKRANFSFQLSRHYDGSGRYRLIVYAHGVWGDHLDVALPEDAFDEVRAHLEECGIASWETKGAKEKCYASLYYSDGQQKSVKISRAQAKELREFFESYTAKVTEN